MPDFDNFAIKCCKQHIKHIYGGRSKEWKRLVRNINQKSLDAYNKLWNATEKTLEIIKPGISCKEVYESLSKNLFSSNVKSSVGRMGHAGEFGKRGEKITWENHYESQCNRRS